MIHVHEACFARASVFVEVFDVRSEENGIRGRQIIRECPDAEAKGTRENDDGLRRAARMRFTLVKRVRQKAKVEHLDVRARADV